jgi:serine/threonine protein kinase
MAVKISSGGFGSIFKVNIDNTSAVLKVVPHKHGVICNVLELVLYFSKCLNIVQAFDYEINSSCYKILMPIALYDLTKIKRTVRHLVLKDILFDICKGVKYLHDRHIVHGDIKPGNILLFKENKKYIAKLTDFSLSRICKDKVEGMAYTLGYRPPETENSKYYTFKSDIWALGETFKNISSIYSSDIPDVGNLNFLIKNMCNVNLDKRFGIDDVLNSIYFNSSTILMSKVEIIDIEEINIKLCIDDISTEQNRLSFLMDYFREKVF